MVMKNAMVRVDPAPRAGVVGSVLVLVIRGVLLWAIVPLTFAVWLLTLLWSIPRKIRFGAMLGWVDINFLMILTRGPLRFLFRESQLDWVPLRDMAAVRHRVWFSDLVSP
jgi:hypothetical protein